VTLITVSMRRGLDRGAIPIIEKGIRVPIRLLKSARVYGFYTTFHAVDTDVVRAKPDYWTIFLMGSMDGLVLRAIIPFPQDPQRREWR